MRYLQLNSWRVANEITIALLRMFNRVMFRGKFRLLQSMHLAAQKSSALRSSHMAVKGAAPGLAGGDARAGRGVRVRIRLR